MAKRKPRCGRRARSATAIFVAAAALALAPGQARAAQTFYVSPIGSGSGCTQAKPCEIAAALAMAGSGDTVLLAGDEGSYALPQSPTLEQLDVPAGVTVEGEEGQSRPLLYSAAPDYAVQLGPGSRLYDFELHYTNTDISASALLAMGIVERVMIEAPDSTACAPLGETRILDSVCWGEYGLRSRDSVGSSWTLTLRNDTIAAPQEAVHLHAESGSNLRMVAINTIVHGLALDIGADRSGTGTVTATLDHSNYTGVDAETGATVTPTGSATNQTAPPFFVDAETGNFRETADSPTIDAGVNEAANGETDLAGNPRELPGQLTCEQEPPAVTDIGAYEFVPVAPPCLPPPIERKPHAPNTRIIGAGVRHHTVTFRFRAVKEIGVLSFQCELAEEPFRPCSSPKTYTHLRPGKYRFTVRAVGQPGGIDLTPAIRSVWVGSRR
ncbi:MAG: choice-of-anchor Q domain-containing protein [Solirubrobacterales bacterium]